MKKPNKKDEQIRSLERRLSLVDMCAIDMATGNYSAFSEGHGSSAVTVYASRLAGPAGGYLTIKISGCLPSFSYLDDWNTHISNRHPECKAEYAVEDKILENCRKVLARILETQQRLLHENYGSRT